jgi:hypothetical protein
LVELIRRAGHRNALPQARVLQLLIQQVAYDGANGKVAVTFRPSGLKTLGRGGTCAKTEVQA